MSSAGTEVPKRTAALVGTGLQKHPEFFYEARVARAPFGACAVDNYTQPSEGQSVPEVSRKCPGSEVHWKSINHRHLEKTLTTQQAPLCFNYVTIGSRRNTGVTGATGPEILAQNRFRTPATRTVNGGYLALAFRRRFLTIGFMEFW